MNINLNIKVYGGKRTELSVEARPTAVNEKTMVFKNGRSVTDTQIAEWMARKLESKLKGIEAMPQGRVT